MARRKIVLYVLIAAAGCLLLYLAIFGSKKHFEFTWTRELPRQEYDEDLAVGQRRALEKRTQAVRDKWGPICRNPWHFRGYGMWTS